MSESLRIVGGLLSPELLGRVFAGDAQVAGTSPESYGLERGESVRRQASKLWPYLLETWQDEKKRDRFVRILLRELDFPHQMPGHLAFRATGWDVDLDHRTPNREARAPHAVMQEQLNTDDSRLWGILTNGTTFRLLRDSASLVTAQYLEFDLSAIFEGELFADFVQFYLTCHATRFAVHGEGGPEACYLEQWRTASASQGERALEQLRKGVEQAISLLGTGFISHPSNPQLRSRLASNELRLDDLNRALLRLVYRILFWFVAEDRDALLLPFSPQTREPRERYAAYFSAARLRQLARKQRGTKHTDLFDAVALVFDALGAEGGVPELAIPGIGGIFEAGALDEPLAGARLTNEALLDAVRALAVVRARDGGALRRVDFGNLGAEELGSVYESLLELIPHYDPDKREYTLTVLAGNERKESGSYYTPSSLVECLLDSALDPLLDEACSNGTPEEKVTALLDLTVCDPACGSGHFLVAAARRIAKRIAAEETGESEPPEPEIRRALRCVVGRCIYGVDINPMAAELAKVSLWLEGLEPGKPLSYLDQNIRVGNSLLGVTPALLADGLPDAAFTAIEGDDKKVSTSLKKQNHDEREYGKHDLFSQAGISVTNTVLAKQADSIAHTLPDNLEDLHIHQQRQAETLAASNERRVQKLLADAWCAAFVQPKTLETRPMAVTHAILERLSADDERTLDLAATENLVIDLTRQYRFFHWHIEFPHIFRVGGGSPEGWTGGFSCVIGNPPWEKVELKEQEFFAQRSPDIASAPNQAARKKLIAQLPGTDPALYAEYANEQRRSAGLTHFLKDSGCYPLTGQGRLNTYALFAETASNIISSRGREGLVLPTGIATDAGTAAFFGDLVRSKRLASVYDFENEDKVFSAVHNQFRFCLHTITGRGIRVDNIKLAFRSRQVSQIAARLLTLTPEDIAQLNPNTLTCPVFGDPRHAKIVTNIYRNVPILWRDHPENNPWSLSFMQGLFNMASDSSLFRTSSEGDVLPLYEAKLVHQFDQRFATYEGATQEQLNKGTLPRSTAKQHANPGFSPTTRYWVARSEVDSRLARRAWSKGWLLGWRDIARSVDERTLISAAIPLVAVGDKYLLAFTQLGAHLLQANLSSFILDYVTRQKFSGASLKYFVVKQLPVLPPTAYGKWADWIRDRVLELTYTAWDMEPFARDLGDDGPPFRWDEERRFLMRAELDALYFHLYGIPRGDVDYIMETFPIVKRKDIAAHGTYRTKDTILSVYDDMTRAKAAGTEYQTRLTPPPGNGPRHPSR